ncbi:hypothetical protein TSAR_015437, partial [Trichomalopsis sarcophagae]
SLVTFWDSFLGLPSVSSQGTDLARSLGIWTDLARSNTDTSYSTTIPEKQALTLHEEIFYKRQCVDRSCSFIVSVSIHAIVMIFNTQHPATNKNLLLRG